MKNVAAAPKISTMAAVITLGALEDAAAQHEAAVKAAMARMDKPGATVALAKLEAVLARIGAVERQLLAAA